MKIVVASVVLVITLGVSATAWAHGDPTKDPRNTKCDTWSRKSHRTKKADPSSHHHTGPADQDFAVVKLHNHGGHYVLYRDEGYVEIVGGQGYTDSDGNQGGFVQGEIDAGNGAPDADFHADAFAGGAAPYAHGLVCVTVADTKVATS